MDTIVELSGAIDALRIIIMERLRAGHGADGEAYLIMRVCDALNRLQIEGLSAQL